MISSDDGSVIRIYVQINILEARAGVYSLNRPGSDTISYSSHFLKTEAVKYIN